MARITEKNRERVEDMFYTSIANREEALREACVAWQHLQKAQFALRHEAEAGRDELRKVLAQLQDWIDVTGEELT